MKYLVRVTETFRQSLIVEADSKDEAEDKASEAYNNGDIRIDYDDFYCHDIDVIREANDIEVKLLNKLEVKE